MASENKEAPARDDTILISPDGDGPATELLREAETMQAPDEAWPVAEFYRVEPDEDLASASQGDRVTVIAAWSTSAIAATQRFPSTRSATLLVSAAAIGGIILAAIAVHLLRDSNEPATASVAAATTSGGSRTTSPSTPSTSAAGRAITVRDVERMSLEEGRRLLERAGLRTRVRRLNSDRPRDEILNQSPAAGAEIRKNGLVVLVVSKGAPAPSAPESAGVPEVVGLAASEAVEALRGAGLDARIRLVESSEAAGTVIRQSPAGNTQAFSGAQISLDIAKRRPAPQREAVPDVAGLAVSAARRTLKDAGFTMTVINVPSSEPVGTVVGQSPHSGATLRKGAAVTVRVSSAPVTVDVPNVTGLDEQSARF
jgi:beta-lactam-binding protein with PASTA domain